MISVLEPGLLSTIQDLGRFGYLDIGVPICGVMDSNSAGLANILLGNEKENAVLEMTMKGPKLQFNVSTQIVITGADISPHLNDVPIANGKIHDVKKDDILGFGKLKTGLRAYLAVKDGFKTDMVFGSRSFYQPVTALNQISKNLKLAINKPILNVNNTMQLAKLKPVDFSKQFLNVYRGPEYSQLSKSQSNKIMETPFLVSKLYNRMAYQLLPIIENHLDSIITSPVLPGTVQLTPSGRLIVLMRDCQTTGGYPRVLQLSESAINLLSQKKERDIVKFKLVET